jgi:trk system potassium uptake protein TrkA
VVAVHSLRRGAAEALEAVVRGDARSCRIAGRRVDELRLPAGAQIGALVRGLHLADGSVAENARPRVIIAHHDTTILQYDHVIVFVPRKRMVRDIERLFQVSATFF